MGGAGLAQAALTMRVLADRTGENDVRRALFEQGRGAAAEAVDLEVLRDAGQVDGEAGRDIHSGVGVEAIGVVGDALGLVSLGVAAVAGEDLGAGFSRDLVWLARGRIAGIAAGVTAGRALWLLTCAEEQDGDAED